MRRKRGGEGVEEEGGQGDVQIHKGVSVTQLGSEVVVRCGQVSQYVDEGSATYKRHVKRERGAGTMGKRLAGSSDAGSEATKGGRGCSGGGATASSQAQRSESMSLPPRKAAGGPRGPWLTTAPLL